MYSERRRRPFYVLLRFYGSLIWLTHSRNATLFFIPGQLSTQGSNAENSCPAGDLPALGRHCPERELKTGAIMRIEDSRSRLTHRSAAQEDGFLYVVGSVVARWLAFVDGCVPCKEILCQSPPSTSFIFDRKYTEDSQLHYPSTKLTDYISAVDNLINRSVGIRLHRRSLVKELFKIVSNKLTLPSSVTCPEHRDSFPSFFLKKWICASIRIFLKDKCEKYMKEKIERRKRRKFRTLQIPAKRIRTQ